MPGDVADVSVGMGMMKSSVRAESACGCMITDTCSRTVSGIVFDTLNYAMVRNVNREKEEDACLPGTRCAP